VDRLTAVFAVDDAELGPAEVLQQVEVDAAQLGSMRVDVEGEHMAGAWARVQTRLDVRDFERVAHRVDIAGDAGTSRTEDRRHTETRLVTYWPANTDISK